MTLNGHFALKSVSGSASKRLACSWLSDKTVRKFAELRIYCQRPKFNAGNLVSGDISFMELFAGVPCRGSVKRENTVFTALHMLFTDV